MKKLLLFLTLLLVPVFSVYAAGSVTLSKSSLSITKGSSASFNIVAKNAAGRVDVSSSNKNVATVSVSNAFLDNSTVKVKVTAKGEGTATISVKLTDVATYDGAVLSGTKTVKVTVKKAEPAKPKTVVKKEMQITNFEIVGYDIDFNLNNKEYTVDISKDVDSVYILVEGKNFTAKGDKKVNIKDLTQTVVTLKDDVKENKYTIKFNKKDTVIPETKVEKETIVKEVNVTDKKYFYISIGLGILSFILLIACLTKKKEPKDYYGNDMSNHNNNDMLERNRQMVRENNVIPPSSPTHFVEQETSEDTGFEIIENVDLSSDNESKFVSGTEETVQAPPTQPVAIAPVIDTPDFIEVK